MTDVSCSREHRMNGFPRHSRLGGSAGPGWCLERPVVCWRLPVTRTAMHWRRAATGEQPPRRQLLCDFSAKDARVTKLRYYRLPPSPPPRAVVHLQRAHRVHPSNDDLAGNKSACCQFARCLPPPSRRRSSPLYWPLAVSAPALHPNTSLPQHWLLRFPTAKIPR